MNCKLIIILKILKIIVLISEWIILKYLIKIRVLGSFKSSNKHPGNYKRNLKADKDLV